MAVVTRWALPPTDRQHKADNCGGGDHDRQHPDETCQAASVWRVVDVLAEAGNEEVADLGVGGALVDHPHNRGPDGPRHRRIGLGD